MLEKAFNDYYKILNKEQRLAVDTIEGPVMVVAGPGTGKTQILTLRIANILRKTDVDPENILALTFTESGVHSMRKRLAKIIGSRAYAVEINTFHGFCNDVIKKYPEEFPRIIGSTHISEVDQIKIIEEIIMELPLQYLRPFGDQMFYVRSIISSINNLKREGVSPDEFSTIIAKEIESFDLISDLYHEKGAYKDQMKGEYQKLQKKISKNSELSEAYKKYQEKLQVQRLYDYSDMIIEVLRALSENKDLLLILQEEHQYILVDEHQDTNNAQNKIMELLASFHDNPNIFVVGDEKQAIFRFQGASVENFNRIKNLHKNVSVVTLKNNYRSSQNILDASHSLLKGDEALVSGKVSQGTNEKINLYSFGRAEVEHYFIARDVGEKISQGVQPQEIAILYRNNKDAFAIAKSLSVQNISYSIESDQDLFTDSDIRKILILLQIINSFGDEESLSQVLHIDFLGIDPLDVYKMVKYGREHSIPLFDIIKSSSMLAKVGVESEKEIRSLYKKLSKLVTISKNSDVTTFFEHFIQDSGFLAYILGKDAISDRFDVLNSFFAEVKSIVETHPDAKLADFMNYLNTLSSHGILIKKRGDGRNENSVRLMTVHKSKGQEFDYVYIVGAYNGHFGNKRKVNPLEILPSVFSNEVSDSKNNNDDERRLFYVALTRAREGISLTYTRQSDSGKEQLPSQFIEEIDSDYISVVDTSAIEQEYYDDTGRNFPAPAEDDGEKDVSNKELIAELFIKNGLSVTAINNYLTCPWRYFYNNLIRIPRTFTKHQLYGTAIHNTLESFFEKQKENEVSKETLIEMFIHSLSTQPLTKNDHKEVLEKGKRALDGYYDAYSASWNSNLLTEFYIKGVLLTPDIRLTGKIDKIEFLDDSNKALVIDYKTKKPVSRREIEGQTKKGNGDLKRQLVFYKLLLDRYENGKYDMKYGVIDFIEPNERGKYKKEEFEITDDEVIDLEHTIKKISEEILSLSFWDTRCGDKECEYCSLRELMK
ncbi:hypothetical protein COB64_03560 [Candidatus Wolfebacteria bacterium]|nr:MAG: hypothetical protein COB64_03560 [Candidatus Wolfebacteria bacterium]